MSLFETSFLHINRVIRMWSTQIKVMSCFRDDDGRQRRRLRSENARRMPWIEQAIGKDDVGRGGEVDTAKLCGGPVDTRCHAKLFFALVHVGWNVRRGVWIPHASLRHRKIEFSTSQVWPTVARAPVRHVFGCIETGARTAGVVKVFETGRQSFEHVVLRILGNVGARRIDWPRWKHDAVVGFVRIVEHRHVDERALKVFRQRCDIVGRLQRFA
mmetsp:Transcript_2677/g.4351  ORF Transcript_2677/g.4351 Transcript_2677/m.4351 type:complete len:214 (+) Transcript_2677:71-712(+)